MNERTLRTLLPLAAGALLLASAGLWLAKGRSLGRIEHGPSAASPIVDRAIPGTKPTAPTLLALQAPPDPAAPDTRDVAAASLAAQGVANSGALQAAGSELTVGDRGRKGGGTGASAATPLPSQTATDAAVPDVLGLHSLDRAGIQSAVRSVLPEVRECYEGWLKVHPGMRGSLFVHMTIERDPDDDGHAIVTSSRVLDTQLDHAALEGCLLNALSEPDFEPLEGENKVEVTYPFEFDTEAPSKP